MGQCNWFIFAVLGKFWHFCCHIFLRYSLQKIKHESKILNWRVAAHFLDSRILALENSCWLFCEKTSLPQPKHLLPSPPDHKQGLSAHFEGFLLHPPRTRRRHQKTLILTSTRRPPRCSPPAPSQVQPGRGGQGAGQVRGRARRQR